MDDTLHESLLHFQFNALRNLLIFEIILENRLWLSPHCVKRVQIRCLFWSVFSRIPAFSISLRIQPKCEKMRTRKKVRIWALFTLCIFSNIMNQQLLDLLKIIYTTNNFFGVFPYLPWNLITLKNESMHSSTLRIYRWPFLFIH